MSLGSIESLSRHFVFPNRISGPMALPEKITETLRDKYSLECIAIVNKAMGEKPPLGVLKVTVLEAEDIIPSEWTFEHYKKSENIIPLNCNKFVLKELLPKRRTASGMLSHA